MKQSVDSPRFSWWDSQLTAQCTPASDSHGKRATPVVETVEGLWHSNRLTDREFPWKLWLSIFKAEVSWGYKCHRFLDNLEWYSLLDEMLDCWQHRQGVLDQLYTGSALATPPLVILPCFLSNNLCCVQVADSKCKKSWTTVAASVYWRPPSRMLTKWRISTNQGLATRTAIVRPEYRRI